MAQETLEKRETAQLIGSDKVEGTAVYDAAGERLGTVKRLMIDKLSGRVVYAVMSFGGFLGVGRDYHPLPWDVLEYDTDKGGYVVAVDRRVLEGAPVVADDFDWADRNWAQALHEYYNTPAGSP